MRVLPCVTCGVEFKQTPQGEGMARAHMLAEVAILDGCATVDSDRGAMRQLELFEEEADGGSDPTPSVSLEEELF